MCGGHMIFPLAQKAVPSIWHLTKLGKIFNLNEKHDDNKQVVVIFSCIEA